MNTWVSNWTSNRNRSAWLLLVVMLLLTLAAYWPSLRGGYIFDDATYLVDNNDVHVSSLSVGDWWRATISQCGINPSCRPLSSITFAINYYFTGLDPFWLKLTNVFIHLCNGLLVFLVFRELFRLKAERDRREDTHDIVAAALAGLWLLLPINLTAVAYVSQRMEALAILFVLLGLFAYLRVRRNVFARGGGDTALWLVVAVCTLLGLAAKEDAALLPLMTVCIEISLLSFRNSDARLCKPAIWTHVVLLLLPAIAGMFWLAHRIGNSISTYRDFTIVERLMTEARVLIDYVIWTLFPSLNSLTFYHDDLPVSHGLLDPPTTLISIIALCGIIAIAFWQKSRRPLFCLGVLWFFAGHSMTATIVPLELVFEHRNYLPSIGLLLATTSFVALEPGLRLAAARIVLTVGFLCLYCFTTFLRAEEWSDPIRLAYSEAIKRPNSQRAQYELARTLIVASGDDAQSPLIDKATAILTKNALSSTNAITGLQALIFLNGRAHRPIDPHWWATIIEKLHQHAPSQDDIGAIIFLYRCQANGQCPPQSDELLAVFVAALERSNGNANLMSAYADFALTSLNDVELAERMSRAAADAQPAVVVYRANLIHLLLATNQLDKAQAELVVLKQLNRLGSLDGQISALQDEIIKRRAPPAVPSEPPNG